MGFCYIPEDSGLGLRCLCDVLGHRCPGFHRPPRFECWGSTGCWEMRLLAGVRVTGSGIELGSGFRLGFAWKSCVACGPASAASTIKFRVFGHRHRRCTRAIGSSPKCSKKSFFFLMVLVLYAVKMAHFIQSFQHFAAVSPEKIPKQNPKRASKAALFTTLGLGHVARFAVRHRAWRPCLNGECGVFEHTRVLKGLC